MVVSEEILDALKQIGLNLYERKLWVALLSRGVATAGELSTLAKVPHSRTYDVLESLAEKGFVLIQHSKPLKYTAVPPKEALERAKRKLREDFETTIKRIDRLQSSPIIRELERIYKKGVKLIEPAEITGSLKGRNALYRQLESVIKDAKDYISILTTSKGLVDLNNFLGETLKNISKKGVKIKIAAPFEKTNEEIVKKMKEFAEVRRIDKQEIIGRFCVVDDSHVVMALTDEDVHPSQEIAFWSQSEHVASDVLRPMFDFIWEKLKPA
jgi:sugar-specific transcriptional regulator TrmB